MISNARVKKLFNYLLPLLHDKSKKELEDIHADIEKILGYDSGRAMRWRQDAKARDGVIETLMRVTLTEPRMSMPA
jgi:hypothetical protein